MTSSSFCSIEICNEKHYARGFCSKHYGRHRRYGNPVYVPDPEETRKKTSKLMKSLWKNDEYAKMQSDAHKGQISPMKGKKHTKEANKKNSESHKGKTSWNKGIPSSLKTRKKLSESHKGQVAWNKGVKMTEEQLRNMILVRQTPEYRQNAREKRKHQILPQKDTKIEKMIQIALSLYGIKFEKHVPISGQPDIFIRPNFCIFVDGEHWHADPRKYDPDKIIGGKTTAKDKWVKDRKITTKLENDGYIVIRFWENEIILDVNLCAKKIIKKLNPP